MDNDNNLFEYYVTDEYDGYRIDKLISELIDSFSRTYIKKIIDDKKVSCNDKIVKASFVVSENDHIKMEIPPVEVPEILPQDIPLDILYEDSDVLVVNKPKDMVVHPAAGHYKDTLVNAVMYHCKDNLSGINGVLRPGIVHRIDKDTTGSVIICKNDNAHQKIAEQLKEHSINRVYHAICYGIIKEDEGTISTLIGRSPNDRKKMAVVQSGGKEAVTHFRVLKRFEEDSFTYIECKLETGRTHQIRVHMAHIGHPLLGDEVYSSRKSKFKTNGQCLHAKILGFVHPTTNEYIETNAPLPEYFSHLLDVLK
ncbi:23S rRNA pseudouridine1911/1915/1917 synthase [Butyrivibrio hungatei DSM 14810]|uniref:Pseudouridine synthase n=2 Tax=Butyrivibrio hungatei TaxID=185008 RepID=A0A1D9P1K2_9FIRM|nr:RluA family pseudouridine synthase [Butyrivibrio hungatei]AOZ96369.1 pseudouridine synthase RluA family [Butyrivibrio hungatei]SHN59325.1 23S rRNA pseudouridine1911/1915/1917 synthase [Butyrivibrio hungatei DSM 14810]